MAYARPLMATVPAPYRVMPNAGGGGNRPPMSMTPMAPMQMQQNQAQSGGVPLNLGLLNALSGKGGLFGGGASNAGAYNFGSIPGLDSIVGSAGASGTTGATGAGSAAASSGGGGLAGMGSLASFWPAAVVAAIAGNETYQHNIGNRDNESFPLEYGITGRALYKDKDVWGDKADKILPGLGGGIRIAGLTSSPLDMFRGDTWKDLGHELMQGGLLGGLIRKVF